MDLPGPTSLYLPLLVWWSAPPTSGVYPTGGPAIPATAHTSLLTAPVQVIPPIPGALAGHGHLQEMLQLWP